MSETKISAILTVEGLRKFQSDMNTAGDAVDRTGKRGRAAGMAMSTGMKAGFLAAGAAAIVSVKKFASFDDALNRVRINSGASATEMAKIERAAIKMGKKFPASSTEVAEAMNEILKAGMSVEDMLSGGLENALAMATAEGLDMATSATAMSQAMAVFAVEGKNANTVTAALSNVASGTSANINDLTSSLAQVGGTAAQAGMSVGDTSAALGVLIQNGLDGSKAGTALNSMLLSLRAPTDKAAKALKRAGVEVYDASGKMRPFREVLGNLSTSLREMSSDQERAAFLQRTFGVDAQQAASILSKQIPLYDKLATSTRNIDAPVQKARDQMKSLAMQLDTTGESLSNMAMQVGAALAPALESVLPLVQQASSAVGGLPPGVLQAGAAFLALTGTFRAAAPAIVATVTALRAMSGAIAVQAALSGATGAMGLFAGSMGAATIGVRTLTAAMMANPLFAAATVAASIVAVAVALNTMSGSADRVGVSAKTAAERVKALDDAATQLADAALSQREADAQSAIAAKESAAARANLERLQKSGSATAAQLKDATDAAAAADLRADRAANTSAQARKRNSDITADAITAARANQDTITRETKLQSDLAAEIDRVRASMMSGGKEAVTGASKIVKLNDRLEDSRSKSAGAASSLENLRREFGNAGGAADGTREQVRQLSDALNNVPKDVRVNVSFMYREINKPRQHGTYAPPVPTFATGGRVFGPGSGTSDKVPAMLSAGEWVLTAKQARAIGYGTLASLPKFAAGGPVARPSGALKGAQRQAAIDASPARALAQATRQYNAALAAERGKKGDALREAKALTKQRAADLVSARRAAAQARASKASAGRAAGVAGVGSVGTDLWKQSSAASVTESLDDDLAALQDRLAKLRAVGGPEAKQAIADTLGEIWTVENVTRPAQEAAAAAAAMAAAVQAIGAKGSDLWKQSSLAQVTESLDDDLAVLQSQLAQLQAIGGDAAAGAIADTIADIWTLENITRPAQEAQQAAAAAAQQAQADAWRNEAAMALGRGFYSASGGAGGGGSMGITDTAGGDAGGVGHAPRPEVDRVWLAGQQINDLDARTGVGCEVVEILGWDEAEDFESTRAKRADGDALGGTRDGSVKVVVRGRLRGSSYQDYHERRRALKAIVRAAVDVTLLKVPDITFGDEAGDYPSTYADAMAGMERRIVRLTSNLKWGESFGLYGSEWEFELRSPHRFVEADVAAEAPSGDNAAAMAASSAARTSILAIRGEVAASPAMDSALKFAGTSSASEIAVRCGGSSAAIDSFTKLSDPLTLPPGAGTGVAFASAGGYMAVAHNASPYVTVYKRSGNNFAKLADPATLPTGTAVGVAFSADDTYLAVAHQSSPYVTIYKRSGDVFTKLADPASLPAGTGVGAAFSPDGTYLSIPHQSAPYVTIYKRSGDTFTKLTDPAITPTGNSEGAAFDPSGTYLAVAHQTSPYVTIYKRSGDVFTKLTDPATLPASTGQGASFSPDGTYLAVAHNSSPYVTIYKRSGDTFTKLTDPASLPASDGTGAAFSPDGVYLSITHGSSPYVTIYKRSGDVFTKLTNPASLPPGACTGVAFSPDVGYMAVASTSSVYVAIYAVAGSDAAFAALGTLRASPPSLAISGRTDTLPVASADISPTQPLTSQDSFDIDTIAGTATPVHRTPLARLIGGSSFIAGIIPPRYAGGPTTMLEIVTRSAPAGAAVVAIGALLQSNTDVVNSTVGGEDDYIGVLGALTASPAQVATGLPGWRAKRSAANFTASSFAVRGIGSALGQPKSRPVIHCMLVKPAASYATATTDLNAFGAGVTKFAHLLTHTFVAGSTNHVNAVGFFHNGTRMQPTCVRYDDKATDGYRFTYASAALSITPDASSHVWVTAIVDAGSNLWNAIALVDVNTGEPLMYFVEGHDMFDGGASATFGTTASQATTTTTSGTMDSSVAYPTTGSRSIGCGTGAAWAASVAGTTVPAGGMGPIIVLDAAEELADHGITSAATLVDASTQAQYEAIGASIVEWIRARFAPQSIRRDPIALEVEWADRVPDLHGEPVVRLDSVPASTTEQALGASRTGGLSTEQMVTAEDGGAGEAVIEAREVR